MESFEVLRFILMTIIISVCKTTRSEYMTNGGTKSIQQQKSIHKFTGGYTGGVIPIAIQSTRNVEVRPVNLPSDPIEPAVVLVDAGVIPLTILFRSASSSLTVMQQHNPGQVPEEQHLKSEDEPHRLTHEITKPIIQEVREVLYPYRRVVQEIQPVQEDIHTIVARGQQTATGADKYSKSNSGTPDVGSYDNNNNNFGTDLNRIFGGSHINSGNHDQYIKPVSSLNLNRNDNNPSSFWKAWSSSSKLPTKATNLGFNDNNLSKSSFGTNSQPINYKKNNQSTDSKPTKTHKITPNRKHEEYQENNEQNIEISKVKNPQSFVTTVPTSTKPPPPTPPPPSTNEVLITTKPPKPTSATTEGPNKETRNKMPIPSPVQNLRAKGLLRIPKKPKKIEIK